jgi:hypothetical protein
MPQPHATAVTDDEPAGLERREPVAADAKRAERTLDDLTLGRLARRDDDERPLGLLGELGHTPDERALDAARARKRFASAQLLLAQGLGELEERERISSCRADEPGRNRGRDLVTRRLA